MGKRTWYEQKMFVIFDADSPASAAVPEDGQVPLFIQEMAKYGWENDLSCDNAGSYVYLRRDALRADRQMLALAQAEAMDNLTERLQRVERGDLEKLAKLDERVDELDQVCSGLQKRVGEFAAYMLLPTEVADPALLKAMVVEIAELKGIVNGQADTLSVLTANAENRVGASRGGVAAAMDAACPGTTWKIEIEGGKR